MAHARSSAEVRVYIREKIRAGKFLIKSLHQRQQTILNIAKEIVHRQKEFMEKGAFNQTSMSGDEFSKWLGSAEQRHRELMKEAGFIAK